MEPLELVVAGSVVTIEQEPPPLEAHRSDSLGCGCSVSDASRVLCALLRVNSAGAGACAAADIRGMRCLELGAGTGVVGLVAAALGAKEVLLTDLPSGMPLLRRNIARNSFLHGGCKLREEVFEWGVDLHRSIQAIDVILAADVVYREDHVAALVATIGTLMMLTPPPLILAAQEKHAPGVWQVFLRDLRRGGLDVDNKTPHVPMDCRSDEIEVVVITRPQADVALLSEGCTAMPVLNSAACGVDNVYTNLLQDNAITEECQTGAWGLSEIHVSSPITAEAAKTAATTSESGRGCSADNGPPAKRARRGAILPGSDAFTDAVLVGLMSARPFSDSVSSGCVGHRSSDEGSTDSASDSEGPLEASHENRK